MSFRGVEDEAKKCRIHMEEILGRKLKLRDFLAGVQLIFKRQFDVHEPFGIPTTGGERRYLGTCYMIEN